MSTILRLSLLLILAVLLTGGTLACAKDDSAETEETAAVEAETEMPTDPITEEPMSADQLPEKVARVNETIISRQELVDYAEGLRQRMAQSGVPPMPENASFYRSALDQLIGGVLLYDEALAQGHQASEQEIAAQVEGMRSRFPSAEVFAQTLAAQGMTEGELEAQIQQGISIQRLIDTEIVPAVVVTSEDEQAFYQENIDQMQRPEQIRASHILIRVDEGASDEDRTAARQKVDSLLEQARSGGDFAELARDNSDDPGSGARGGDLDWFGRGMMVPPFEAAAFALQPGEISEVVESPFGFHIILLTERRAPETVAFDEAAPRIRELLTRQGVEEAVEARIDALRSAAEVETFV